MDLQGLHIFIQVAELKSFTRAAEKLGYSQPTVSFQVKQLEEELGVRLFDRMGHTTRLTEEGRRALSYAQDICRMSQEMTLGAQRRREPAGLIRLAMPDSLCAPLLGRKFAVFRRTYPRVALQIVTAGTGELFRLLDHNEVDLVCTLDHPIYDTNYVIVNEEKVDAHFVAAAGDPLAGRAAIALEELVEQPFLLTEKGMSYRRLMDERLARAQLEIKPVLEMGSADLICRLVEEGTGLSFLPDYVTRAGVAAGRLVRLPVVDFNVELWKQLFYRREKWVSLEMKAAIRHLSEVLLR